MNAGRGLILGIESSCDETAAAVVRAGGEVLANVVASQIKLHANYGGVVPELASREHLRNIVPVVRAAMAEAARVQPGLGFADLDAIAVTEGPGLAGALLVGITYAKALALGLGKPLIAVNHLEGHIHAVLMETAEHKDQGTEMRDQGAGGPLLALVVSGGHTHLYLAEISGRQPTHDDGAVMNGAPSEVAGTWRYWNVGRTVDDAAGEAFDKVAKLLGLGYPGGPWMDVLAARGNPRAVEFKFGQIKTRSEKVKASNDKDRGGASGLRSTHSADGAEWMGHPGFVAGEKQIPPLRYGMTNNKTPPVGDRNTPVVPNFDFSFSGIKTAVLRYIQTHGMAERIEARRRGLVEALKERPGLKAGEAMEMLPELFDAQTLDLIASFQYAVVGNLMRQTFAAAEEFGVRRIVVSGGVAANSELRRRFAEEAARRGLGVAFPTLAMSTDNAAMIAAAAWPKFVAGEFAGEGLVAVPQLRLG
jgi:N6-L-threonylcarbamoyladenine synthase